MTAGKLPGWLKPMNRVMVAMQKLGITAGPVTRCCGRFTRCAVFRFDPAT